MKPDRKIRVIYPTWVYPRSGRRPNTKARDALIALDYWLRVWALREPRPWGYSGKYELAVAAAWKAHRVTPETVRRCRRQYRQHCASMLAGFLAFNETLAQLGQGLTRDEIIACLKLGVDEHRRNFPSFMHWSIRFYDPGLKKSYW